MNEKHKKMMSASYLMPTPGGAVVRELLEECQQLESDNKCYKEALKRIQAQEVFVRGLEPHLYAHASNIAASVLEEISRRRESGQEGCKKMKQYKKRPVVIEAVQLTEDSFSSGHPNPLHIKGVDYDPINKCAYIDTLEGRMTAQLGDWIIKGVKGELYSCKDDIFKMTYESVNCERYRAYLPTDNPPALCEADCIGHGYQECGGCYYLKIDESIMERRNDGTLRDSESE